MLPDTATLSVLPKETPAYKKESKTLKGFTVIPSSDKNTRPITKAITKKNKKNVSRKTTVSNNITCCCMNLTLEEFLLFLCNFTEFSCYCWCWSLLNEFEHVLTSFNNLEQVSTSFNKFQRVSTSMNKFEQVWTSFNKFEWVSTSFNKFERVSTCFNKFEQASTSLNKFEQVI